MARNLCTDSCVECGRKVLLADLRGKPVEFRRYGPYPPQMGTKHICTCGMVYFVWVERNDSFWSTEQVESGEYKNDFLQCRGAEIPNKEKGRFVVDTLWGKEQTGYYRIDMSHYYEYNDEQSSQKLEEPRHLCEDEAETTRWDYK